eukprot:TRINITY_DN2140_c0_g2_i4.p1 TRINITY_DN2140_c0_g2~~TRINITY_DN2140_c0_g2_i4.p1  ORF type:complete len:382 (+),score=58.34 TRINITY_DN2140_c0_g2_i4:743-1888(+)
MSFWTYVTHTRSSPIPTQMSLTPMSLVHLNLTRSHLRHSTQSHSFASQLFIPRCHSSYSNVTHSLPTSAMLIVMVKRFLQEDEEGSNQLFQKITSLYGQSMMVSYFAGYVWRFTGQPSKAIECFDKTLQISKSKNYSSTSYHCYYLLGYCHFLNNNWAQTINNYETFLSFTAEQTGKTCRPYAAYCLGVSYWMADEQTNSSDYKNKISKLYLQAKAWVQDDETYDKFALRKMNKFLADGCQFSPLECFVISIGALLEGENYQLAEQNLIQLREKLDLRTPQEEDRDDYRSILLFLEGCLAVGNKKISEAETIFNEVIKGENKIKEETWLVPSSLTEMGDVAFKQKDFTSAKKLFENCKRYNNYDWDKLNEFRIYIAEQLMD